MKRLLLVTILSILSYISYAPTLSVKVREEVQKSVKCDLFIQTFPTLAKLNISDVVDIKKIPIMPPIDTLSLKRVNSSFGYRIHPILNERKYHTGIDLDCPIGTEILSAADGYVEEVKLSKFGYGNYILINHENGYKTRYTHLQEIKVCKGQPVTANELIGISGRSGLTTGPHLHYEIIKDDKPIDPVKFITDNSSEYIGTL